MVVANKDKIRILSIDGGGLRGLIAARTLQWIEKISDHKIHELFDVITGTSTGGLIAAGLSAVDSDGKHLMSTEDLIELYTKDAEEIFPRKPWYSGFSDWFQRSYSSHNLEEKLKAKLEGLTLRDCIPHIQVAAYDIANDETIFFKSRYGHEAKEDNRPDSLVNASLVNICRATSAAPTYFKSQPFEYQTDDTGSLPYDVACIDGGVFVNNPTLAGIVEIRNHPQYYCECDNLPLENFYCLSIGTGEITKLLGYLDTRWWGQIRWAKPAIEIMMKGVNQTTDYQVRQLLPDSNYLRINPPLDREFGKLDDTRPKTQEAWLRAVREHVEENGDVKRKVEALLEFLCP